MPIIIWVAIFVEVISALLMDPVSWIDVFILLMLQFLNVVVGFYEELQVCAPPSTFSELQTFFSLCQHPMSCKILAPSNPLFTPSL